MDLKSPVIKALTDLQALAPKGSQDWLKLEDMKKDIEAEKDERVIYHKLRVLREVLEAKAAEAK